MAKLPKRHHQCPDAACRQSGLGDGPRQQMEPCHGEQTSNRSRASCARSSRSPLTMRHSEHHSRRHGWGCMQVVLLPTRVRSRARSRVRRTTRRIETEKVGLVQLGGLEPPTSCSTDRNVLLPPLRPFTPEYELLSNFNIKDRTGVRYTRSSFSVTVVATW